MVSQKEQKELEGKIDAKKAQLEKAKDTLDLIPDQHGYQNALEVTKAMKLAKAELKKVQIAQKYGMHRNHNQRKCI